MAGKNRLGANQVAAAATSATAAAAEAVADGMATAAAATVAEAATVATSCASCLEVTADKVAMVEEAAATVAAAEEATATATAEAEAARLQGPLATLITVLKHVNEVEQWKHEQYTTTLSELSDILATAAEISDYLIGLDKTWPITEKGKALGMDKAAKSGHFPARAIKAFNVFRSNYAIDFTVTDKAIVKAIKQAETLAKADGIDGEDKATLQRAISGMKATADGGAPEMMEAAADRLDKAIEMVKGHNKAAAEAVATEAAAVAVEKAARIANLATAKLSRVLLAIRQLADNEELELSERGLILSAGAKVAARVAISARMTATEAADVVAVEEAQEAAAVAQSAEAVARMAERGTDGNESLTDLPAPSHD